MSHDTEFTGQDLSRIYFAYLTGEEQTIFRQLTGFSQTNQGFLTAEEFSALFISGITDYGPTGTLEDAETMYIQLEALLQPLEGVAWSVVALQSAIGAIDDVVAWVGQWLPSIGGIDNAFEQLSEELNFLKSLLTVGTVVLGLLNQVRANKLAVQSSLTHARATWLNALPIPKV